MKHVSLSHRKLGSRIHALAVIPIAALLGIINLWNGPPYWVLWVLAAGGIGLLAHWWFVLGPGARKTGPA